MRPITAEIATIYCDESGNTGSDLLSKTDLFFVYAWVLLTKNQETLLASQLSLFLEKECLPLSYELSSVKLWQSSRGRRRWSKIMQLVYEAGTTIYISIVEKKFEICVRIASTYLDPDHNPKVDRYMMSIEFRRFFHNVIYSSISSELLTRFLRACHSDDVPELKRIGLILSRQLSLHPDQRVVHIAHVIMSGLDDIYRFGERLEGAPKNIHLSNCQVTAFFPSLIFLDSALGSHNLKARLIRDQDTQFGEILDFTYEFLSRSPSPMHNFIACSEEISASSIGIQIADLAAGIAARIFTAKVAGQNLKPNAWNIWKSLRMSLSRGNWSYQLTSGQTESKLASLWDFRYGPNYLNEATVADKNSRLKCSCGELIASGEIRDYYIHVMEQHPDGQVIGLPCRICNELIPFMMATCHEIIDHSIDPPFRGDFYFDMQKDYAVLQLIKISHLKIEAFQPKQ